MGAENLFEEITAKNFLSLGKELDIQIQEAQRSPDKSNPKMSTPRHRVMKIFKKKNDKKRISKASREKKTVT